MIRLKSGSIVAKLTVVLIALIGINVSLFFIHQHFDSSILRLNNAMVLTAQQAGYTRMIGAGISAGDSSGLNPLQLKETMMKITNGLVSLQKGGSDNVTEQGFELPASYSFGCNYTLDNIRKEWTSVSKDLEELLLSGSEADRKKELTRHIHDKASLQTTQLETLNALFLQERDKAEARQSEYILICCSLIFVLAMGIWRILVKDIKTPLDKIRKVSSMVAEGDLSLKADYSAQNEIGLVAEAINNIIDNQVRLASFAEEIGEGNFSVNYDRLSDKDKLGISLVGMCDKLRKVNAEEKSRSWANEGYAKFAEILRSENDTLVLGEKILINLVKYIDSNQGALFLVNDEDPSNVVLNLISAYAWDRKKYIERTVAAGEGLIGQTYQEGETIYLTDIPSGFIQITSGLGKANPTAVLIVPLKVNDAILGVLELAFFRELEKFEIEFVERLAESIASTLSSVKVNEKTVRLLEESRRMTQEMTSQEEELRQNMEELQATQEEMERKEVELVGLFASINNSLSTMEFSMEGLFLNGNEKLIRSIGYELHDLYDKEYSFFISNFEEVSEVFGHVWEELRNGVPSNGDFKCVNKAGKELWMSATFTPVKGKDGYPYKVIVLAQDITEKKKSELAAHQLSQEAMKQAQELKAQEEVLIKNMSELEAIKGSLSERLEEARGEMKLQIKEIEIEKMKNVGILEGCVDGVISFDQHGKVEFFNRSAEDILGYKREEIIGKNIAEIISLELIEKEGDFSAFFSGNNQKKQIEVRTEISLRSKSGEEVPVLITLSKTKIDGHYFFTAFMQSIAVELF